MRKAIAVGRKEFRQIARDRRSLLVLLFVPAFWFKGDEYRLPQFTRYIALALFALSVDLFPAGDLAGVVTQIRFHAEAVSADPLVEAIAARCANRRRYRAESLPPGVRAELQDLATAGAARLSWIDTDPGKRRIAALAAENDRVLFENRALHDGLYRWIRWSPSEAERLREE